MTDRRGNNIHPTHRLKFSVRKRTTQPTHRTVELLAEIMGCHFRQGYHLEEIPAWETELLGMRIYFHEWRGVENARTQNLHGAPSPDKFSTSPKKADFEFVDISNAVIDLLGANGGGKWYIPSTQEIDAEIATENA